MKAGHAEALRVGGSFSGGGSHPAKAEAQRELPKYNALESNRESQNEVVGDLPCIETFGSSLDTLSF